MESLPDTIFLPIIERVFEYDDYREFLRDFFAEQKKCRACFSHRFFARQAGLSSPSFCLDVVKGKFNLTLKTIPKVIRGLGLRGKAAQFFEALVGFNQAKNPQDRDRYYAELVRFRKASRHFRLSKAHYEYFSDYSLSVLRELAVYAPWKGDYRTLGKMMNPSISANRARAGVEKLLDMGLLKKDASGAFHQTHPLISTTAIPAAIQRTARREILKRGIEVMDTMSSKERHLSHATVSMSRDSYEKASTILDEARRRIVELAINDKNVEKVYEIVFQAFPVSENLDSPGAGL